VNFRQVFTPFRKSFALPGSRHWQGFRGGGPAVSNPAGRHPPRNLRACLREAREQRKQTEMSQIRCGKLTLQDAQSEHVWEGKIAIGKRLDGVLALIRHPIQDAGASKKAPAWEVVYKHAGRQNWSTVGSAWNKISEDGKTEFVSMSLDNPDWDAPLNLSGFKRPEQAGEVMDVVWSRPRGGKVQNEDRSGA
jgi:uncharacterized protein (DUF736 family)